jgi:hypothetical protein
MRKEKGVERRILLEIFDVLEGRSKIEEFRTSYHELVVRDNLQFKHLLLKRTFRK